MITKKDIVSKMMTDDYFSQWLGIEVVEYNEDNVILTMIVRKEMLNGYGIAHGGIYYSLADSALAFSASHQDYLSITIDSNISHFKAVKENAKLITQTKKIFSSKNTTVYMVEIKDNNTDKIVAYFKGTILKKNKII